MHCGTGLPQFSIVGLAETAVRESRERVRAALAQGGFRFPDGRVTVNLAPADLPKEGGRYDLAVALGILAASGQLPASAARGHRVLRRIVAVRRTAAGARLARGLRARRARGPAARRAARQCRGSAGRARRAGRRRADAHRRAQRLLRRRRARVRRRRRLARMRHGGAGPRRRARPGRRAARARDRGSGLAQPALRRAARAPARACWRSACPGCCRRSTRTRRSSARCCIRWCGRCRRSRSGGARRFARRTTAHRRPPSSAAAGGCVRARSRSRIAACCSSTSCRSTAATCWRRCANRSKPGSVSIARAAWHGQFPARFQLVAAMNPCPCGYAGDANGRCRCTPPIGAALRRAHLGAAARSHRPARRRAAARVRGALTRGRGHGIECDRRRAGAGRACRQATRGALNAFLDARRLGDGLRAGPARAWPARCGDAPARAVGARLPPDPARRAHDRGPRRPRTGRGGGTVGGDRLPAARSRAAGAAG